MKPPRFKLRTLLFLIALLSVPMAWTACQVNWIRQRHAFLESKVRETYVPISGLKTRKLPWSLRLFGEHRQDTLAVRKEDMAEAVRLFPEAAIFEYDPVVLSIFLAVNERIRSCLPVAQID